MDARWASRVGVGVAVGAGDGVATGVAVGVGVCVGVGDGGGWQHRKARAPDVVGACGASVLCVAHQVLPHVVGAELGEALAHQRRESCDMRALTWLVPQKALPVPDRAVSPHVNAYEVGLDSAVRRGAAAAVSFDYVSVLSQCVAPMASMPGLALSAGLVDAAASGADPSD